MTPGEAHELLALAEAAETARLTTDEAPNERLRESGERLPDAFNALLAADLPSALRLAAVSVGYWLDEGRVEKGRQLTEQVVAAALRSPDRAVATRLPPALVAAAELAFRQGDQTATVERANGAIEHGRAIGDRASESLGYSYLARVAYRNGNAAEIERHAQQALALAGDDALARRNALHMLAWAAHTAGDLPEARRRFEASLEFRRALGNRFSIAVELANLGDLAIEEGDLAGGLRLLGEALSVSHEIGNVYMLVNTLPSFAAVAARAGRVDDAAVLFGATDALIASSGLTPDPGMNRDEARAEVAAALGEGQTERYARGRSLSRDGAVALALEVAAALSD
jgi:tetratricopeptide (TPR) repeat protein